MKKISFGEKLGYGVGAVGLDLSYGMFYSYLSIYLTNALGISPAFLLIITPLARLWDGFNDPMMGMIVDKTQTKMGKYRPWILMGALMNAVVLCLLFNNPGFASGSTGLYVYAAVLYVFWGMTNTLADIPFWSMVPSFATEEKDRNLVSTIARAFSGLGQGIVSIFTPMAVAFFGGVAGSKLDAMTSDTLSKGFGKWSLIMAGGLILFALISVLSTKERRIIVNKEKFSFRAAINVIKSNDQLLVFMLFAMISNAGFYMTSGISSYYFTSVLGDLTLQSKFNLMGTIGSVLSILVVPVFSKFMNNRSIYKLSLSMAAAGYIGMAVIGYLFGGNVTALGIFYILTSLGTGSMFVNQTVMLADCVDYGEYKTGSRNQSLIFSMKGFLQKMAYTVQAIIMYATFTVTGYDGEAVVQTAQAKSAISFLMFIVPPTMMIASLIIFSKKYKIFGDFKKEVLESVSEKQ
ncbi:MAG: MFS transporter [Clostridia bacterium]|nr:MFS transporter [Clostridia bacterium]